MNETGDQDTEVQDSAEAGLMTGAGNVDRESFEMFKELSRFLTIKVGQKE